MSLKNYCAGYRNRTLLQGEKLIGPGSANAGEPLRGRAVSSTWHIPLFLRNSYEAFSMNTIGGEKVQLEQVAQKGPVVLVTLRGFPGYQCPLCTAQVGQLMSKSKEFEDAKANVILVYPGPAEGLKDHASEFVEGKAMPKDFDLLLDPDFSFTKQYGLRWDAAGETAYPSTFVLDSKRKVLFAKVSHSHGDRANVKDVLAALPK